MTRLGRVFVVGGLGAAIACCSSPDTDLSATLAKPTPASPVGWDAYVHWERWPILRIGTRTYVRSTYDRKGGNDDADASHFLRQRGDGFVTLDVAGPGALLFFRANNWHGSPWHFVVDGAPTVASESNTSHPDTPRPGASWIPEALFPSPIALTSDVTAGADVSWVRVPFASSLSIAYERSTYGTGYYVYQTVADGEGGEGDAFASWDRSAPPPEVSALFAAAGTDIAPPGDDTRAGTIADASLLADYAGAGTIRAIAMTVPIASRAVFEASRVRVTWDDRAAPSIDVPAALFFGAGTLDDPDGREWIVKSIPASVRYPPGAGAIALAAYFPMPFASRARVELVPPVSGVAFAVRATRAAPETPFGYFHATYTDTPSPAPGRDVVMLDTRGVEGAPSWCGHVAGTTVVFSHAGGLATLEGDPRFFFDDSGTPQVQGTGSEEWAAGGDYFDGGQLTTLPLAGHPVGVPGGVESLYRFLLADATPFGDRAVVGIEHGGLDESTEHYETVAYWYGAPAPCLVLADALHVSDDADEAAHAYVADGASAPVAITSRYEVGVDHDAAGDEVVPAATDTGRVVAGASEMTFSIPADNAGLLLRRKLDYAIPDQRADVFVDGERAGTWYLAGGTRYLHANPHDETATGTPEVETSDRRFRDDEFLVPRRLTRGKTSVRVRFVVDPTPPPPLVPGEAPPAPAWSELRYSVYAWKVP